MKRHKTKREVREAFACAPVTPEERARIFREAHAFVERITRARKEEEFKAMLKWPPLGPIRYD